ncbi:hypothetical protein V6N13_143287 [Hibiscus sabdariffa]|uniref:Uncharacterized protein n=1 Tax=Hibiscus sabdariffa TaxID=183260 RepID=A0ABR2FH02_9ROSI
MASLVLLLSQLLLRHREPDFASETRPCSSSPPPPPSPPFNCGASIAKKSLRNYVGNNYEPEIVEQELSVCVHDLVWP